MKVSFLKKKGKSSVNPKTKKKMTKDETDSELPTVKKGEVRVRDRHEKLGFFDKWKLKKHPETTFLVEIFFSNGTSREFVIKTKDETFDFRKRTYYLRYEDSKFNLTQREYKLYYHEDYAVPIDNEIYVMEDESQKSAEKRQAFFGVRPHNLKPLIRMEYIKALAESQELSRYLKMLILICGVNLLVSVYFAYSMLRGGGVT